MEERKNILNIYEKLASIQKEIVAPKGRTNNSSKQSYTYRSCEDIEKAAKPLLDKYKATIVMDGGAIEQIGNHNYMKVTVSFIDLETSEIYSTFATVREPDEAKFMSETQQSGACCSYARKYALAGLLLLDAEKDHDAMKTSGDVDVWKKKIDQVKVEALRKRCNDECIDLNALVALYKVKKAEDLTEAFYANIHQHWDKVKATCTKGE